MSLLDSRCLSALKRADDLFWLQLLKQSRGNPSSSSHRAWELFYLVASTMPPSKDFVGLVSEYVHTVAHNEAEDASVKVMAQSTWSSLKRSAKAGARRTVSLQMKRHLTCKCLLHTPVYV